MTPDADLLSLRFGAARGSMPPVGALYLAASLESAGLSWRITDTQHDSALHPFAVGRLEEIIRTLDAPVLAFSVFNDAVPLVVAALRRMDAALKGRRVFLGGPGVVGVAPDILRAAPAVEAVVVGEGERALPLLIRDPTAPADGVFRRNRLGFPTGSGRTTPTDLSSVPLPPWEWCRGRGYSLTPCSTARGCPFDCAFCEVIAFMGRKHRAMPLPRALNDLHRAAVAIGPSPVYVLDDTFTLDRRRAIAFCDGFRELGLERGFSVYSRIDTIDEEVLERLAGAGCTRVFFGIDGADDDILRRISKRVTIEQAVRVLHMASVHVDVTASFIWGYPFESLDSVRSLVRLAFELYEAPTPRPITPQLHLLSPSAGTAMFTQYGADLEYDPDAVVLPLETSISGFRLDAPDSDAEGIIQQSPRLGACFYRYRTPAYPEKQSLVRTFRDRQAADLGAFAMECLTDD